MEEDGPTPAVASPVAEIQEASPYDGRRWTSLTLADDVRPARFLSIRFTANERLPPIHEIVTPGAGAMIPVSRCQRYRRGDDEFAPVPTARPLERAGQRPFHATPSLFDPRYRPSHDRHAAARNRPDRPFDRARPDGGYAASCHRVGGRRRGLARGHGRGTGSSVSDAI